MSRRFRDAAEATLAELSAEMAAGTGQRIHADDRTVIERYLLPVFGRNTSKEGQCSTRSNTPGVWYPGNQDLSAAIWLIKKTQNYFPAC